MRRQQENNAMKRKFPRTYTFKLTVSFNKGCRAARALYEVRNEIYGEHYCTPTADEHPDTFRISSIKSAKRVRR
jgi:hypothetical protein